jgi:tRNA(Glu) U13 pseudouridine synthase TruD
MQLSEPGIPKLKTTTDYFIVVESLSVELRAPSANRYQYLLLQKVGFTTFEAVDAFAGFFSRDLILI